MGDSHSRELGKRHPYPGELARILGQRPNFGPGPNLGSRPNLGYRPNLGSKPSCGSKPILGPKPGGLLLGLGLDPKHKSVNQQAWTDAIGAKMVPARVALLPEANPRWH